MNPDAQGSVFEDVPFTVDPDRVGAFRELFGRCAGVPPTFLTAAEFTVLPTVIGDPRVGVDFTRVVHGSQEYVFERPLREGEELTIRPRIDQIRVRGGTGIMTIVMELLDPDGRLVATARSTMIERAEA